MTTMNHNTPCANCERLEKRNKYLNDHIGNQFPTNKLTAIKVIEDHSQVFQMKHAMAEKEIQLLYKKLEMCKEALKKIKHWPFDANKRRYSPVQSITLIASECLKAIDKEFVK